MTHTQPPSVGAAPVIAVPKAPKEMLSIQWEETPKGLRPHVRINYSSLDAIQTCLRKSKYLLLDKLVSNRESEATMFGTAIHKGLETWYLMPIEQRRPPSTKCDGEIPQGKCPCPRCEAMRAFLKAAAPLELLDIADKRHPSNGIRILDHYIRKYIDDPFEVLKDAEGMPMTEKGFSFTLYERDNLKITYFGTIDVVLHNVRDNLILVVDHKTTGSLGKDFYTRIKPNAQYTGYLMGARRALGLNTDLFLVNGLQVAKTKSECTRQVTHRDAADFAEFEESVITSVETFLEAQRTQRFPLGPVNACAMFGGCSYHTICEANSSLRPQIISSLYQTKEAQHGIAQLAET